MKPKSIKTKFRAEYCAWKNAIDRCERKSHPQYNDYGGRGIKVADEFICPVTGFVSWLVDVGKKPDPSFTLERVSNDKGYEANNQAWVSRRDNQLNRRKPKAKARDFGWGVGQFQTISSDGHARVCFSPNIEFDGKRQTVKRWSEETGLNTSTIIQRLQRGWKLEDVLSPIMRNPHGKPRKNQPNL
ncbi:hypothetical protein [Sphingomonas sp. Leaf257]|jgi:hypothetical protein|uniref:hypothetical protein n=1 Tax=Sphingomonas sp. Leaf257 TaxID=1736309 RepID=UPI000B1358C4|nr:hypothetical protein [Sphingomonas sp. Leaf257]